MKLETLLRSARTQSRRLFRRAHRREIPLCIFCYHKVGTVLFSNVMREICEGRGWNFTVLKGYQPSLPPDADVVLFSHSLVELDGFDRPFRGVHLVRDPRDVIVSGYLYHQRTTESWCVNTDFDPTPPILWPKVPHSQQYRSEAWKRAYLESLGGRSYQRNLLERDRREGLLWEMDHYGAWTIDSMRQWDYRRDGILELKFEEVMRGFDEAFRRVFTHFGFTAEEIESGLTTAAEFDLKRKSAREIDRMKHVSSPRSSKWQEYFEDVHKQRFIEKFDDVLVQLGYESSNRW